jgi:SAM-dependent methyltransferase
LEAVSLKLEHSITTQTEATTERLRGAGLRPFRLVFALSVVSGIAQLAIVRELSANHALSTLDLSVRLITGVVLATFGLGAALVPLTRRFNERSLFAGLATAISIYLLALLFVLLIWFEPSITADALDVTRLLAIGAMVSPPFVGFGLIVAQLAAGVQAERPHRLGVFVAASLAGTALGLMLSHYLAPWAGVNTLLLTAALMTLPVMLDKQIVAAAVALLLIILPTEKGLESLRERRPNWVPPVSSSDVTLVYSGWSPYQKIDLYTFEDQILLGCYNGYWQWWSSSQTGHHYSFPGYDLLYAPDWTRDRDVLVIGSGAGMGLLNLEKAQPASVVAVELDPTVVELARSRFAAFNASVYDRVSAFAMEGRSYLDSTERRFDLIVYEGSFITSAHPHIPVGAENYLYTREGLRRALDRLEPDGVALVFYAGPREVFERIREQIQAEGAPVESLLLAYDDSLWPDLPVLIFGHDANQVGAVMRSVLSNAESVGKGAPLEAQPTGQPQLTDVRPFLNVAPPELHSSFLWVIIATGAALLLGLMSPGGRRLRLYYYSIGAGLMLAQYWLMTWFRSFFGDPVSTSYTVLLLILVGIAAGSASFERLLAASRPRIIVSILVALGASITMLAVLPHSLGFSPWVIRLLVAAIALVPLGWVLGLFFPFGLRRESDGAVPVAYLFDALGAVAGFFIFYHVSLLGGLVATAGAALAAYVVALASAKA